VRSHCQHITIEKLSRLQLEENVGERAIVMLTMERAFNDVKKTALHNEADGEKVVLRVFYLSGPNDCWAPESHRKSDQQPHHNIKRCVLGFKRRVPRFDESNNQLRRVENAIKDLR